MNTRKTILIALATVALLFIAGFSAHAFKSQKVSQINSYDECAAAGYPIMESYPEQCRVPDGRTFTRVIADGDPNIIPSRDPGPLSGTLSGYIHTGPTCPVERIPQEPGCEDRPYANASVIIQNKTTGVLTNAVTDSNGNFQATLAAGTYTVQIAKSNTIFPVCEAKEVTVISGKAIQIDISCDSGIR